MTAARLRNGRAVAFWLSLSSCWNRGSGDVVDGAISLDGSGAGGAAEATSPPNDAGNARDALAGTGDARPGLDQADAGTALDAAPGQPQFTISPKAVKLRTGSRQQFLASGAADWEVKQGASGGTVDSTGLYVAPVTPGTYHVVARSRFDPSIRDEATVTVALGMDVLAGKPGGGGYLDAVGINARFSGGQFWGIATDGDRLFVADTENRCIRQIVIATGAVSTLAGSPGPAGHADGVGGSARFDSPAGIVYSRGSLYVTDKAAHVIRRIVVATGAATTVAGQVGAAAHGDGIGMQVRFSSPGGIATDGQESLFVADSGNRAIRRVVMVTGETSTISGIPGKGGGADGDRSTATWSAPFSVAHDGRGNLYVTDESGQTVRRVAVATGQVSTLAGAFQNIGNTDGDRSAARFNYPAGLAIEGSDTLFVGDRRGGTIRKVVITSGTVTTLAGMAGVIGTDDGNGASARFGQPTGLVADGMGNLFVTDLGAYALRRVVISTRAVTTIAGAPESPGDTDGIGVAARFTRPNGIAYDGRYLYVSGYPDGSAIRRVEVKTASVTSWAGTPGARGCEDGAVGTAKFSLPHALVSDGTHLFVADQGCGAIRKVRLSDAVVTTLAGGLNTAGAADGVGPVARFTSPEGLALGGTGLLYVADSGNNSIRQVAIATGETTTIAGKGVSGAGSLDGPLDVATFRYPTAVAVDPGQRMVYVVDRDNHALRKIDLDRRTVTTLAGTPGVAGSADGAGPAATFNLPRAVILDGGGDLLVTDSWNHLVRRVTPSGVVTTFLGNPIKAGIETGFLPAAINHPSYLARIDAGFAVGDFSENVVLIVR